ncbi:MAG: ATP-dependent DNA helicase [Mariprofundaceae bacterium]
MPSIRSGFVGGRSLRGLPASSNDRSVKGFPDQVATDFNPGSTLAHHFGDDYCYRPEQQSLAARIAEAIDGGGRLLAEAETGIGKTMAYLVPALHSDDKVLISTHTKALQDQLMHRDLPQVRRALGRDRETALLKGRSSYLCPHRLEHRLRDFRLDTFVRHRLAQVAEWARQSVDGDLSSLGFDMAEAGLGSMITATAEQCLGRDCPQWMQCPLVKARNRAQGADIVIANHSLLLADAALKAGEFGEVLPEFDAYVLDEAHSLPDLASQHFGLRLGRQRFTSWGNDMQATLRELADESVLQADVTSAMQAFLQAYGHGGLEAALPAWGQLAGMADSRRERSEDMAKLADRAAVITADMQALMHPAEGYVAWSDGQGEQSLHFLAPVETGAVLAAHLWRRPSAFILLSATLRISGTFDHAERRLGLEDALSCHHPSPFDYAGQALLYLPRHLPPPAHPDGEAAMLAEMIRLLSASSGRAFVLFTSHRMLRCLAPQLAGQLPWPVLEQGRDGTRDGILNQFRQDKHSILCGTRSFWEGVDVPGEALSMVIVDKLPFAPPSDPLLQARIKACEEAGGSGFRDIQLPEAIAVLRQGVGRLIRSSSDRGVMAILDVRIHTKSYGRQVVRNLPPAPVVHDMEAVRAFYAQTCIEGEIA